MRRGAISLGDVQCDECHQIVEHSKRYLAIEEENGAEADKGKTMHYCMKCAKKKHYVREWEEKGEKIVTVFPAAGE